MPGMKRDCGGAAGVLGAFRSAVKLVSVFIRRKYLFNVNIRNTSKRCEICPKLTNTPERPD